jgi:hypothetical protein
MKKLNTAVFCAVLAAFIVMITAFPRDGRTVEIENRSFNEIPEWNAENVFSGEFAGGVEPWVSDLVGRRADFTAASMAIAGIYGVAVPEDNTPPSAPPVFIPETPAPAETPFGRPSPTPAPTPFGRPKPTPPPEPEMKPSSDPAYSSEPEGTGRVKGPLLVFDDRLVEIFGFNRRLSEKYAGVINAYRAALPENVRVFSLIAPTAIEFMPEKYKDVSDSELDAINAVNAALDESVIKVAAYAEVSKHTDEYLYFRTDHHWTALGAYYAYIAFADAAGFEAKKISEYEEIAIPGFLGYLYNMSPTASIREKPDTIYCYKYNGELETTPKLLYLPGESGKATYSVFMGGDHPKLTVNTSVKNGKTAVVIKDSFANAFLPWLAPHYENIVVLDPRHFEGSAVEVAASYESADLIFLDYAITTSFSDFINAIESIR